MQTKFLLITAFLLICLKVSAQHYISLEGQQMAINNPGFRVVEVLDGRENKGDIGQAQKGLMNSKNYVYFSGAFAAEIANLIKHSYTQSEKDIPVALVIHDLHVSELTKMFSESSKAEITVSFFVKEGENKYLFVRKLYSSVERSGLGVTGMHPGNVAKVLEKSFLKVSESDLQEAINKKESLSTEEVMDPDGFGQAVDELQAPIFQAKEYQNGIFATSEEFLMNEPSIKNWYEIKGGNKKHLWLEDAYGVKKLVKEGVYGFAENNQLYILFHKSFFPVQRKNDGFYFMGPKVADPNAVMAGALLGGVIGGAIAASASGERSEYRVDLETGRIYEEQSSSEGVSTAKLVFYRRDKREQEKGLNLMAGDSLIATVMPNQYGEIEVPVQEITLCLEGASCITFVPYGHEVNYVSCSLPKKGSDSQALLEREEKKAGEFYVSQIQLIQSK